MFINFEWILKAAIWARHEWGITAYDTAERAGRCNVPLKSDHSFLRGQHFVQTSEPSMSEDCKQNLGSKLNLFPHSSPSTSTSGKQKRPTSHDKSLGMGRNFIHGLSRFLFNTKKENKNDEFSHKSPRWNKLLKHTPSWSLPHSSVTALGLLSLFPSEEIEAALNPVEREN